MGRQPLGLSRLLEVERALSCIMFVPVGWGFIMVLRVTYFQTNPHHLITASFLHFGGRPEEDTGPFLSAVGPNRRPPPRRSKAAGSADLEPDRGGRGENGPRGVGGPGAKAARTSGRLGFWPGVRGLWEAMVPRGCGLECGQEGVES